MSTIDAGEPTLLAARPMTDAERVAQAEEPRPGTWFGDRDADGRTLSQADTDLLIRAELVGWLARSPEQDELLQVIGGGRTSLASPPLGFRSHDDMTLQRGGLDSDPLVRVLAYRAWGDRDRRWLVDRGVRTGDPVALVSNLPPTVARPGLGETELGVAVGDAPPGAPVVIRLVPPESDRGVWSDARPPTMFSTFRTSDRLRDGNR